MSVHQISRISLNFIKFHQISRNFKNFIKFHQNLRVQVSSLKVQDSNLRVQASTPHPAIRIPSPGWAAWAGGVEIRRPEGNRRRAELSRSPSVSDLNLLVSGPSGSCPHTDRWRYLFECFPHRFSKRVLLIPRFLRRFPLAFSEHFVLGIRKPKSPKHRTFLPRSAPWIDFGPPGKCRFGKKRRCLKFRKTNCG